MRAPSFSANSSATDSCTRNRLAAVQASPMLRILAIIAPSTAASTSASSKTMNGALPPSSIETRCSSSADCRISTLPTVVEPVKLTLRSRSSAISALLSDLESLVVTMLRTPAGRPTSSSVAASASIVSGVSSAGLTTIVQPAAMAGPILRVPMASGKFHGVMNRHGPDRLLDGQQPAAAGRGLHPAAVDAHGLLGEPPEELRAVGDLALGLLDGLAHLEAHQLGEVVGPRGDQLERAAQDLAAVARGRRTPLLLGRHRRIERVDRVVDVAVGHLGDDGPVGGVADGEGGAAVGLAPGAADEEPTVVRGKQI